MMNSKSRNRVELVLIIIGLLLSQQATGVGHIAVYAFRTDEFGAPPPSTSASVNNSNTLFFSTNSMVLFPNQTPGTYTVEVATAASGYLLRESPDTPKATSDPESSYGNPRYVYVTNNTTSILNFNYDPIIRASGTVRDAWTMERLEGAAIEFMFQGSTGTISTCKYPWTASYASNWTSQTSGDFPTNTILYLNDYDLKVSMAGYQTFTSSNVITNAAAGDTFDLGDIFLVPTDTNTNQIDDLWEIIYFGTYVSATADPDGDGVCNRNEYLAGTDPTGSSSVLHLSQTVSNDTMKLTWNTEPGRTYRVTGTTDLSTGTWVQVAGTWEATNGQSYMSWTETNMHLSWRNSYCVEVVPCYWTGTNQILIRTNDWPTGGSGSGTNSWPGLPPLP